MDGLNKIRVSNVKYADGERFYDDILLDIGTKGFDIDFINGGGKTFLAQCIMQAILPKSHFTGKHPFKELYKKENNNNTIHSLIEWKLGEGSEFEYMITGFCSRKKEQKKALLVDDGDSVENFNTFNYVCFYNEGSKYSIDKIPLKIINESGDTERMSYSELRTYLRNLNSGEIGEPYFAKVFDSTTEYHKLLKDYKINKSEWEMMRELNRKEANAEEYFNKYPTSKSFIRDFLVAKIDEANKINNIADYQSGDDRAESLLSIRNTIFEYSKRLDSVKELDYIESALESIVSIDEDLLKLYNNRDEIKLEIIKGYNRVKSDIEQKLNDIQAIDEKIEELEKRKEICEDSKTEYYAEIDNLEDEIKEYKRLKKEMNMYKSALEIKEKEADSDKIILNLEDLKISVNEKDEALKDLENIKERYFAEDKYIELLKEKTNLKKHEQTKENQEKSNEELLRKLNKDGGIYKGLLSKNVNNIVASKEQVALNIEGLKKEISDLNCKRDDLKSVVSKSVATIENNKKEIKKIDKDVLNIINETSNWLEDYRKAENKIRNEVSNLDMIDYSVSKDLVNSEDELIKEIVYLLSETKESISKYINFAYDDISDSRKALENIIEDSMKQTVYVGSNDVGDLDKITFVNKQFEGMSIHNRSDFNKYKELMINKVNAKRNEVLDVYESNINKFKANIESLEIQLISMIENKKFKDSNIEVLKKELGSIKDAISAYDETLNAKKYLMERYNEKNLYSLESLLDDKIRTVEYDVKDREKTLNELEEELKRLEENKGLVVSKEIIDCYNMLKNKFDNVLLGLDFIKMLTKEEKEKYLDKTDSLIAYSILMSNSDYDKVTKNENLLKDFKDSLIPIINIDKLREEDLKIGDGLYISHRNKEEILDEDKILALIEEKREEVAKFKNSLDNSLKHLDELKSDYLSVIEFTRKYDKDFLYVSKTNGDNINEQIASLNEEINTILEKIEENKKEKEFITVELNNAKKTREEVKSLEGVINKGVNILDLCNTIHSNIAVYVDKVNSGISNFKKSILDKKELLEINAQTDAVVEATTQKISTIENRIAENENSKIELLSRIAKLNSDLEQNEKELSKLNFDIIECDGDMTLLAAKEIFENTQKSIGGKLADLNIVNEAIIDARERVERIKNEIERSGFEINSFDSNFIEKHTELEYNNLDIKIANARTELSNKKDEFRKEEDKLTAINAVISNLISTLQNKCKVRYAEIIIPEFNIDEKIVSLENDIETNEYEIDNKRDEVSKIDRDIKGLSKDAHNLQKERNKLKDAEIALKSTLSNLENLIENEKIDVTSTREMADNTDYVEKMAKRDLDTNSYKVKSTAVKHTNKIDATKTYLVNSTFNFVEDLNEIYCPKDLEECQNQIESIRGDYGYIYLLNEEKNSLSAEIEELQQHQENFITLCVQRCNYVLDKMMEIEEFSKIEIGKEKKSAIQVILNPLPEDERKIKMRNYIINIINEINDTDVNESKIKEIGKSLELKNLFPQILTDINKCRIKIFKINETCDGGKFINWGEAGSTGQTNSMFLYFFMATLVFVRRLSSFSIKEDSRKLLLLDSPFNGTVALNLWKIPLEIMRKNNIQVMVLGYQIPPQLSGMFGKRIALGETIMNNGVKNIKIIKEDVMVSRDDELTPNDVIYGQKKGNVSEVEKIESSENY